MNLNEQTLFEAIESHGPCYRWEWEYKNYVITPTCTWLDILKSPQIRGNDKEWFFESLLGICWINICRSRILIYSYGSKSVCYTYSHNAFAAMVAEFLDNQGEIWVKQK